MRSFLKGGSEYCDEIRQEGIIIIIVIFFGPLVLHSQGRKHYYYYYYVLYPWMYSSQGLKAKKLKSKLE